MKTKCMSCGGTTKKMQTGGSTRPVPGQKKPGTKELKITSAMTNGIKSPNLPPKKRGTGLILKDKPTQEGVYKPKMQKGGPIQLRSLAGQKKDTTAGPVDYSKMGKGLLPKGTVVDSKYSRDKKLKESKLNNKMQKGGSTGKTKKYKTKNSYSEYDFSDGRPMFTIVESPDKSYKKNIEWQSYLADGKKPYQMSVTKGGKTNQFQLSKEQALSQRKKVKKTMGFQKGGVTKKKK